MQNFGRRWGPPHDRPARPARPGPGLQNGRPPVPVLESDICSLQNAKLLPSLGSPPRSAPSRTGCPRRPSTPTAICSVYAASQHIASICCIWYIYAARQHIASICCICCIYAASQHIATICCIYAPYAAYGHCMLTPTATGGAAPPNPPCVTCRTCAAYAAYTLQTRHIAHRC